MKARATSSGSPETWQTELATAVRDPEVLLGMLDLPATLIPAARRAAELFPLRAPLAFVRRMQRGDAADPLLLQVLPLGAELAPHPDFSTDPVGDAAATKAPGLIQKYESRVLFVMTGACAIHCRYCFRRNYPYSESNLGSSRWENAVSAVANDPSVSEVILSGGDPLTLPDEKLARLIQQLEAIPHLKRLRIHSRLPVVLPSRVTTELVETLRASRLTPVMVIHSNHAREFDSETRAAISLLRHATHSLLNQSVLLKGINNSVTALVDLSEALFDLEVTPYYLHRLDRVAGSAHFEVSNDEAHRLYHELQSRLPGYLVPRLVRETAGRPYKTPDFAFIEPPPL